MYLPALNVVVIRSAVDLEGIAEGVNGQVFFLLQRGHDCKSYGKWIIDRAGGVAQDGVHKLLMLESLCDLVETPFAGIVLLVVVALRLIGELPSVEGAPRDTQFLELIPNVYSRNVESFQDVHFFLCAVSSMCVCHFVFPFIVSAGAGAGVYH